MMRLFMNMGTMNVLEHCSAVQSHVKQVAQASNPSPKTRSQVPEFQLQAIMGLVCTRCTSVWNCHPPVQRLTAACGSTG